MKAVDRRLLNRLLKNVQDKPIFDVRNANYNAVAATGYRDLCDHLVQYSAETLENYSSLGMEDKRFFREYFERLEGCSQLTAPPLHAFAEYAQALIAARDAIDWQDGVQVNRELLQHPKAFRNVLENAAKAAQLTIKDDEVCYPELRREILGEVNTARSEGLLKSRIFVPPTYEGSTLLKVNKEDKVKLVPLKRVAPHKKIYRDLEALHSIRIVRHPKGIKELVDGVSDDTYAKYVKQCRQRDIYPELTDVAAFKAMHFMRQAAVMAVLNEFSGVAKSDDQLISRDHAHSRSFILEPHTLQNMEAFGMPTEKVRFMFRDGFQANAPSRKGVREDRMLTLIQPHNPAETNRIKAHALYHLSPHELATPHLGREEDMRRALLHELAHGLCDAKEAARYVHTGEKRRSSAFHERVCDTFASLSLQDRNIHTEMRGFRYLLLNEGVHYTTPVIRHLKEEDFAAAGGKTMMQRFEQAYTLCESTKDPEEDKTLMERARERFDRILRGRMQKLEQHVLKAEDITAAYKVAAPSWEVLDALQACLKTKGLKPEEINLYQEVIEEVRLVQAQKRVKQENYVQDVLQTVRFAGCMPAVVECLGEQDKVAVNGVAAAEKLVRGAVYKMGMRGGAGSAREEMRRLDVVTDDLKGLAKLATGFKEGILKEQQVFERVGRGGGDVGRV